MFVCFKSLDDWIFRVNKNGQTKSNWYSDFCLLNKNTSEPSITRFSTTKYVQNVEISFSAFLSMNQRAEFYIYLKHTYSN